MCVQCTRACHHPSSCPMGHMSKIMPGVLDLSVPMKLKEDTTVRVKREIVDECDCVGEQDEPLNLSVKRRHDGDAPLHGRNFKKHILKRYYCK